MNITFMLSLTFFLARTTTQMLILMCLIVIGPAVRALDPSSDHVRVMSKCSNLSRTIWVCCMNYPHFPSWKIAVFFLGVAHLPSAMSGLILVIFRKKTHFFLSWRWFPMIPGLEILQFPWFEGSQRGHTPVLGPVSGLSPVKLGVIDPFTKLDWPPNSL